MKLTQDERHGDEAGIVVAIDGQLLKAPPLGLVQEKSKTNKGFKVTAGLHEENEESPTVTSPVGDADGGVHGKESQELLVQHLVDAAFPGQQQLGEATEAGVGNSGRVGDRHW